MFIDMGCQTLYNHGNRQRERGYPRSVPMWGQKLCCGRGTGAWGAAGPLFIPQVRGKGGMSMRRPGPMDPKQGDTRIPRIIRLANRGKPRDAKP